MINFTETSALLNQKFLNVVRDDGCRQVFDMRGTDPEPLPIKGRRSVLTVAAREVLEALGETPSPSACSRVVQMWKFSPRATMPPKVEFPARHTLEDATRFVAAAKKVFPSLNRTGIEGQVDELDLECVARAADYLAKCERPKRFVSHSYSLKHSAERALRTYIANGDLIAAAVGLGIEVRPVRGEQSHRRTSPPLNVELKVKARPTWE